MIRFSTAATARPAPASATPLRGRALVLARALWIAMAVLTVLYVVASTPLEFARLRAVCLEANCQWEVLGAANAGDLYARDRSASFFAAYFITVELLFAVVSFATGAVIFWRKSNNRMGLYASLALITFGVLTLEVTPEVIAAGSRTWWFLFSVVRFLGNFAIIPFFYLFPDGSFVPR